MLTRRFLLSGLFLAPLAAFAHDGHDLSRIHVSTLETHPVAGGLEVALRLENGRDTDVTLAAIYSDLGDVSLAQAPNLTPGSVIDTTVTIHAAAWPGIFTLILDFGEAGLGPVTVIPV